MTILTRLFLLPVKIASSESVSTFRVYFQVRHRSLPQYVRPFRFGQSRESDWVPHCAAGSFCVTAPTTLDLMSFAGRNG
jgi:hypothetical protein